MPLPTSRRQATTCAPDLHGDHRHAPIRSSAPNRLRTLSVASSCARRTQRRCRPPTSAHLAEGLYLFAAALENGYYSQLRRLRRYYAKQRDNDQLHAQSAPSAAIHLHLSDDDLPF